MGVKKEEQPGVSLVALNSEYQALANELTAAGGELSDENEARLDQICAALCEKADAYGVVKDQLEAQASFWKYQKERCLEAEQQCSGMIRRLKERMKFVLKELPGQSLQGQLYRFFLAKSKDTIDVDETLLPKEWKKAEVCFVPDWDRIEAAVKEGKEIPGVTVKTDNKQFRTGKPKFEKVKGASK